MTAEAQKREHWMAPGSSTSDLAESRRGLGIPQL